MLVPWRESNDKLENPLDCKEIKLVNPKGNQPWIFIGRIDAEALVLWPPDVKNQLIRKDLDSGKDWRQEEKGMTEDKMVGWHHRLNGHEFEQALGDGEGQGSLVCCSPWGSQRVRHDWVNEQQQYSIVYMYAPLSIRCWWAFISVASASWLLNCGAGEDSWESLAQQGYQTNQS